MLTAILSAPVVILPSAAVIDVILRRRDENRWRGSTGLIEAEWTRTKTPSSGTAGVSISTIFNRSADPGLSR